jgi:ribosomal protein L11
MFVKKEKIVNNPYGIKCILYIKIKAMSATSGPPIGPILGQYGIPIMSFCDEFNKASTLFKPGVNVYVKIFLQNDGDYHFVMDVPGASELVKRGIRITKASGKAKELEYTCRKRFESIRNGLLLTKKNITLFERKTKVYYVITPYILYEVFLYWIDNKVDINIMEVKSFNKFVHMLACMGIYII